MSFVKTIEKHRDSIKTISLPRLNGLKPDLISTMIKLTEEVGELGQLIGKMRGMSGEKIEINGEELYRKIAGELLDVSQTTITMMFVLEEDYDVDIDKAVKQHYKKLKQKGYLVEETS